MDKASLLDLDANALYGVLLLLRDGTTDKAQIGKRAALGGRVFDRDARLCDEGKKPIVLTVPAALDRGTTTLRATNFRRNTAL